MKKNSNKSKETMISEDFEKTLREWKLPPSSASDIFEARGGFNCFPGSSSVKTVEKEIRLREGFASFPLISNRRRRAHQIWYEYLRVGMIQVGLKPGKLGSDASAVICVRDKRFLEYSQSIMGMVESSLCDGPIYFSYFPTHSVCLADSSDAFAVDVNIEGSDTMYGEDDGVTLVYKFHYKVMNHILYGLLSRRQQVEESGKTTLYLTDIQRNRVVSKTISWAGTEVGEGLVIQGKLPSSGVGLVVQGKLPSSGVRLVVEKDVASSGDAKVDWKETLKAHVLKVDVPGFKKEEVRVEVEDGGIIQISGERSNEEEEEESDKWHGKERSGGKFLRRLKLPENAKLDGLKAGLENGVLTVTVPKEEVKKKKEARVIEITAN